MGAGWLAGGFLFGADGGEVLGQGISRRRRSSGWVWAGGSTRGGGCYRVVHGFLSGEALL